MSAIAMTKIVVFHAKTKHIKIWHFIRELIEDKEIKLEFVPTNDQLADTFYYTHTNKKKLFT